MPKLKVNGIDLYYETHGSGTPIVFIAGFSADHTSWSNIIDAYVNDYQVVVLDNRGIGQSSCPDYPYTTEMMTDDVAELIRALNLGPVHIVAHSFGGCIAQQFMHKYPELVSSAVIVCSVVKADMRIKLFSEVRAQVASAKESQKAIINFLTLICWSHQHLRQPGISEQLIELGLFSMTAEGCKNQASAMLDFDSRKWLHEVECPTLIITANEDVLADKADSEFMHNALTNSEFHCLENMGHVPSIEQPELFNKLVLDFIERQDHVAVLAARP